jgi:hypothetical protein
MVHSVNSVAVVGSEIDMLLGITPFADSKGRFLLGNLEDT